MMMRTLKVGRRSALAFSIIVAIVIALGAIALIQMRQLRQSEIEVETDWMPSVRQAGQMTAALLRLRLESLRALGTRDPARQPDMAMALVDLRSRFATGVKDYAPLVSSDAEQRLYQAVQDGATAYLGLLDSFETLYRTGDLPGAEALANGGMRAAADQLQAQIENLAALNDRGAVASGIEAGRIYDHGLAWVAGLILATLLATIALAFLLTRSITLPIGEALRIAQRIANKDLAEDIQVTGRDEAAGLLTALAGMQANLRDTVAHLADSSSQLAAAAEVRPPKEPKTTFTVGTVQGGTSVNAIAGEARLTLDMRSNEEAALLAEEKEILALVQDAVKEENQRWETDQISVDIKLIGDRPAGGTAEDSPLVQTAQRAIAAVTKGGKATLSGGSTDSNTAMSLGVPAMTIGGGGEGGSAHSLAEWYKPVDAYQGPQNVLLTSLTLVGVKGVSEPVLQAKGK